MYIEKVDLECRLLEENCIDIIQKKKVEELEGMILGLEYFQIILVLSVKFRLLFMLDGKIVFEEKYNVILVEKFEDQVVDIKGLNESIQLVIKSI